MVKVAYRSAKPCAQRVLTVRRSFTMPHSPTRLGGKCLAAPLFLGQRMSLLLFIVMPRARAALLAPPLPLCAIRDAHGLRCSRRACHRSAIPFIFFLRRLAGLRHRPIFRTHPRKTARSHRSLIYLFERAIAILCAWSPPCC